MLIDFLFLDPNKCYICKEEYIYEYHICRDCFDKLDYVDNEFLVGNTKAYAMFFYDDFFKILIGNYKFERNTSLSRVFSEFLYEYGTRKGLFDVDYILTSPSSKSTLIDRGFDQIRMITDDFIGKIRPGYLDEFKKVKDTKAQHNLGREERSVNLVDAFICQKDLTDKSVLIIDDILTTGNTAKEIIKVLKKSYAKDIKVLALASEKRVI